MNWAIIDIVFIILILMSSFRGAFIGMVSEILSIAALFISLLLATVFYADGARWIQARSSLEEGTFILAFTGIFLVCYIAFKMLQKGITHIINETPFESVDKLLGFFFGILEGILLSFLLVYLLNFQTLFDISGIIKGSEVIPYMERIMPALDTSGRGLVDQLNI